MADAPEVVPGSFTPTSTPAISPAPIAPITTTHRDEKSPGPPYQFNEQADGLTTVRTSSDEKESVKPTSQSALNEKLFLTSSDEKVSHKPSTSTPAYPSDTKAALLPDRSNSKYAIEEQDRTTPKYPVYDEASPRGGISPDTDYAGCRGIDGGEDGTNPVEQRRMNTGEGEGWHIPLCGCMNDGSGSLCCEVTFMPCILAGRRYLRLKNTKPTEMTSTNAYCLGCFIFTVPLIPFWWVMGMSTRREVRYKYGIKGTQREDCLTSCFCAWCALVQEEKEMLWREELRVGSGLEEGYRRRGPGEQMVYSPVR